VPFNLRGQRETPSAELGQLFPHGLEQRLNGIQTSVNSVQGSVGLGSDRS
jgi:hypothetical protein